MTVLLLCSLLVLCSPVDILCERMTLFLAFHGRAIPENGVARQATPSTSVWVLREVVRFKNDLLFVAQMCQILGAWRRPTADAQ